MNETCDIHEILDNCLVMLQPKLKYKGDVAKKFTDSEMLVEGNEGKLHQAFLNILSNSLDAMVEAGVSPQTIIVSTERLPGDRVQVKISDNGCGIADEIQDKLFDPFFTTKPIGQATGLGLSVAYQIIKTHKGTITVNSQLGVGSEFIVELPIHIKSE